MTEPHGRPPAPPTGLPPAPRHALFQELTAFVVELRLLARMVREQLQREFDEKGRER
jgi:hypothetical protein